MRISKMKTIIGLTTIAAVMAVTIFYVTQRRLVQSHRLGRGIASVALRPLPSLIEADRDFEINAKIRMLQLLSVEKLEDEAHVAFGAFERQREGEVKNICDLYQQVSITVRAEGVAINGEPIEKTFARECRYLAATETISPVVIRKEDLRQFADEELGFWPESWHVSSVRIFNSETGEFIEANSYEIIYVRGQAVAIAFE